MALPPHSEDSTALVTGASSGIGASIARELAERGHGLTLVARREERLRELAGELFDTHGVRTEVIGADLADASSRDALEARIAELGLDVEILVNNAGFGGFGSFAEQDRERELEMVRLNIEAVVDLEGRYLPTMVERGRGAVINIASTASFQPLPDNATYAATKAFVLSSRRGRPRGAARHGSHPDDGLPGPGKDRVHGRGGDRRCRGSHPLVHLAHP